MGNETISPQELARLVAGIGTFYVELTAHLFGGTVLPHGNSHIADIDHRRWNALCEVKGGGNTNGIKVFHSQLEDYLEELGRKREHCLYFVYRYNTKSRHPEKRIWRVANTGKELRQELADRTIELYVVDVRILAAARSRNGTKQDRRDNHTADILWLWRSTLMELTAAVPSLTRIVGFRQGHFKIVRGEITTIFAETDLRFPATFVVPRTLESLVVRHLQRLGRRAARLAREPELSFS